MQDGVGERGPFLWQGAILLAWQGGMDTYSSSELLPISVDSMEGDKGCLLSSSDLERLCVAYSFLEMLISG